MNSPEPTPVDVSVCIANYNGMAMLDDCLRSVLAQQTGCSIEIIVHDDASTDDSLAYVHEKYPSVRTVRSEENVGFCISNNRMAQIARGRYLLLLNNDAILRPGSITALLEETRRHACPVILGLPQYSLHDGSLVDHGYEFDVFMNPIPCVAGATHEVATATGACLWVPRLVWEATDGFPPWFESIAEDIFLCQAARLLGYPTRVLAAPGFDHWIGKSLGGGKVVNDRLSTTARRRALSERNKTMVILLCYPAWALLPVLLAHLMLLAMEAGFLWLAKAGRGQLVRIYGALIPDIWRHRAALLALRRRLQAHRASSGWQYMHRFRLFPHKLRMLLRHGTPKIR